LERGGGGVGGGGVTVNGGIHTLQFVHGLHDEKSRAVLKLSHTTGEGKDMVALMGKGWHHAG